MNMSVSFTVKVASVCEGGEKGKKKKNRECGGEETEFKETCMYIRR